MNRRDFFKSAILIPGIASLLPVLGRGAPPAPTVFRLPDDELVVLREVRWFAFVPRATTLDYQGTASALYRLADCFRANARLYRCVQEFKYRYPVVALLSETWDLVGHICGLPILTVVLSGFWQARPGLIPSGETGVWQTGNAMPI